MMKGSGMSLPVCLDSTIRLMTTNNERTRGILRWINGEHLRIYGTQLEQESPQYSVEYPQQVDSTDCDIFVLTAANYVIKGFSTFISWGHEVDFPERRPFAKVAFSGFFPPNFQAKVIKWQTKITAKFSTARQKAAMERRPTIHIGTIRLVSAKSATMKPLTTKRADFLLNGKQQKMRRIKFSKTPRQKVW